MTTIAWRDGILAADKKASEGDTGHRVTKLHRTKTHAIATAGGFGVGLLFVKWFPKQEGECPLDDCTTALVMNLDTGQCWSWEEDGIPIPIEDKFTAIGTGQQFALGAMAFGATAVEAVEIANEWDNNSGLGINYATSRRARVQAAPRKNHK